MDILHISDIHFGPYHWSADDNLLLDRLNAFKADLVFNTGDLTSDSLQGEFEETRAFLSKLNCPNIVSIIGNHDKYSRRSHEMFREFIHDGQFIQPKDPSKVDKHKLFLDETKMNLDSYFTDVNYLRQIKVDGEDILLVCIDTALFQSDFGLMEEQILRSLADEMTKLTYDLALLLSHHPILSTDNDPLISSRRVTDFVLDQGIEAVFCGHTHEVDIVKLSDLVRGRGFRQFTSGSLSSANVSRDTNMFCTYENFGTPAEVITVTRMTPTVDGLEFTETVVGR
jgi:predicted MPP superfamily phosphohydrolase